MTSTSRLLRLLVTAICGAIVGGIVFAGMSVAQDPGWAAAAGLALVANLAVVAAVVALLVLIPLGAVFALVAPALLARAGIRGGLPYMVIGLFTGGVLFSLPIWLSGGPPFEIEAVAGAASGGAAGLMWWLLVQRFEQRQAEYHG